MHKLLEDNENGDLVCRAVNKDGGTSWLESTGKAYHTATGEVRAVLISRNISDRMRIDERIMHQAFYDPLTGLPNRMLFNDRMTMAIAHAKRNQQNLAVFYLDLDRFKIINDTLGHDLGDQLLRKVAERLTSCVRAEDTIARMGGDEFTLLLTSIDAKGSSVVAQKILAAISQPFNLEGYELYISVSIGIAIYPRDGLKPKTLLKNADVAMYQAKTAGKNRYEFYEPLMNDKALARMLRENSLRRALNEHELVLHYQPKVNVATKSIVGMEALVRWQHPELGLLYPDQFIPLAEYTGLIVPIGEWILRTACAQCKKWQDEGLTPLRVAVNLSYHQFQMQNLVECVSRVLRETGLEPRWLELEISEGLAMRNVEGVFSILMQLKEMGVTITTDDFGLYFSFAGLKYFPVHNLKINRTFVKDIGTNRNNEAIAATVLFLGESMDLGVIAEGVENQDQLDFLMQHNCSMMQGYIFGRPMETEDFKKLLLGEYELSEQEIG
jgi:diguanylate cyclase (GGDEF)-like protein